MKDDPHLWTRDHNLSAEVVYSVEHRAIPPVLDELGKHFGEVRTRTVYPTPQSGSTTTLDWWLRSMSPSCSSSGQRSRSTPSGRPYRTDASAVEGGASIDDF